MTPKTLIIVPVHNEEKHLAVFLPQLKHECQKIPADIVAINDASTDRSPEILREQGITVLSHSTQMGYGVTIQTGYKYALRNEYDHVIQVDGDGQHDPRCIHSILAELRQGAADIVIGSRFLPKDRIPFPPFSPLYYGTPMRRVGIYIFRAILACLCFRRVTDPTSGFIGFNRRVLFFLCGKSFPFDYPDADMIVTFLKNGFVLKEIPVYMYHNQKENSLHRGCRPIWYVIKVFISIFIAFLRSKEISAEP